LSGGNEVAEVERSLNTKTGTRGESWFDIANGKARSVICEQTYCFSAAILTHTSKDVSTPLRFAQHDTKKLVNGVACHPTVVLFITINTNSKTKCVRRNLRRTCPRSVGMAPIFVGRINF